MVQPAENVSLRARARPGDPQKLLAAAILCWVGFAVMAMLVTTGRTAWLDEWGLLLWHPAAPAVREVPVSLLEAVRDLTALGGVLLRNLMALTALTALLFLRLRRDAVALATTVISGWLAGTGLKLAFARPRPDMITHLTEAGGASFPSGHSFNSAVVYLAIALAFATLSSRRPIRRMLIAGALAISLAIAWSRVWLGVHYPSDAIAGWLGGTGWALLAAAILHRPRAGG